MALTKENIVHNHYDSNAFVIGHRGEWLVPDRGYRSRTHPPSTKFQQGTAGHCSVLVDVNDEYMCSTEVPHLGHEQVQMTGGEIVEFFRSSWLDVVKGRAATCYNTPERTVLDRFDRTIVYLKPHGFVIVDELAAPEPHRYSFLLHGDNACSLTPAETAKGTVPRGLTPTDAAKTNRDPNLERGQPARATDRHEPVGRGQAVRAPGETDTAHRAQSPAWLLRRRKSQIIAHVFSPQGIRARVRHWPEAEHFGPFLQAQTMASKAATILSVLVPQGYVNPNTIHNRGFEEGMTGWRPRSIGPENHTVDPNVTYSGKASGRIAKLGYFYSTKFSLPPGTRICARAMANTINTAGDGATIRFHFWRRGKCFHTISSDTTASTEWTELAVEGVVPDGAEKMCLGLYYKGAGAGWFDDVSIECDPSPDQAAREAAPPVCVEPLADGNDGAVVQIGDVRYVLLVNGSGAAKRIAVGNATFETDGRLACVRLDGETAVQSLAVYDGTRLTRNGQALVSMGRRGAVAARVIDGVADVAVQHELAPHAPLGAEASVTVRLDAASAVLNGQGVEAQRNGDVIELRVP